jgi:hypothetical protein
MDKAAIQKEYMKIRGKQLSYSSPSNGEHAVAYVEELIEINNMPHVIMSNDDQLSLFEALKVADGSGDSSATTSTGDYSEDMLDNFAKSGQNEVGTFFPQIKYSPEGIPIMEGIAQTEEEMEQALSLGDMAPIPRTSSLSSSQSNITAQVNPIAALIQKGKVRMTLPMEFDILCIPPAAYDIIKSSFDDDNIDDVLVDEVYKKVVENLADNIRAGLSKIYNFTQKNTLKDESELTAENDSTITD